MQPQYINISIVIINKSRDNKFQSTQKKKSFKFLKNIFYFYSKYWKKNF